MYRIRGFLAVFVVFCTASACAQDWKKEKYIDIDVLGWKVKVNERLIEGDTSVLKRALGLFGKELYDISQVIPQKALDTLKKVTFWFEKEITIHLYTGEYWRIGSQKALLERNANPAKAGGIEIVASRYIEDKFMYECWIILHELAHAYHNRMFKDDERIRKAYNVVLRAKLYKDVRAKGFQMHHHGYALTNYHEYFAELSTVYFGHNYYYPFNKSDLKHYDPIGYKLVEELWEVKD